MIRMKEQSANSTVSPGSERVLTPDLARGFMLLLIALAHAHQHLTPSSRETVLLDQIVVFFRQILVDGRAFPVFFLLFGYGLVQLQRRQEARGSDWLSIRSLLRRRGWWLLLIGFAHAVMLYDFTIGLYGMATIVLVGLLRLPDKKLLWIAGLLFCLVTALGSIITRAEYDLAGSGAGESIAAGSGFVEQLLTRLFEWILITPILLHQVVPAMLIGIWAARAGILEDPGKHRRLLARTAAIGLILSTLGGIPLALMSALFWADPSVGARAIAGSIHTITGYAGGIGWAALIGWIAAGLDGRHNPVVKSISAVGQRSLTFYLFQSLVFYAVFAPSAGGLGAYLSQFWSDVVAWMTWIISIAIAEMMRRANRAGPAETVLRRLVYRNGKST